MENDNVHTYVHMYVHLRTCMPGIIHTGRSVQVDVCSVYSNGQLMAFSLCSMNYSISNVELLPKPDDVSMSWFEEKISSLGRKLSKK